MKKVRTGLTLILILLVGLSVLAAGIFSAQLLRNSYIDALENNLSREITVILASSDWKKTGDEAEMTQYYTAMVHNLKQSVGARVTYIRADGIVLADSDHDPATMDNHLSRAEIKDAAATGKGFAVRRSDTVGQVMLYAAVPVKDPAGRTISYFRLSTGLDSVNESLRNFWQFLLVGLVVLFAVAGLASYRIALGLTRPLEKITQVAQSITNLDYSSRVEMRRRDEIGQLGHAINTMADSLQSQLHRITENESRLQSVLENMTSGVLLVDQTDKIVLVNRSAEELLGYYPDDLLGKRYTEVARPLEFSGMVRECAEAGEPVRDEFIFYFPEERILEVNVNPLRETDGEWAGVLVVLRDITVFRRLERMRSEFVANVSHELKTPVAAVKGFSETLLAGAMDDKETARSFLQIIYDESERLNRLIGDILELSKIESKRVPPRFSPLDLGKFIEQSLRTMRGEAAKKGIRLTMEVEDDLYIEADEDRLRQILINLLSNGVNYTQEGGEVHVKADIITPASAHQGEFHSGEGERIRIIVSDTGIGIPKKDLPRIFERFYRVDKARSRSSGGTGLGLSIVKHLVELHHGTITVESQVGVGSKFIIELPVLQ
jgi:two-component system phosphate regulon sensor histidine kinase PhoR